MKIIDSHTHLGDCRVFDMNIEEDELMRAMEEGGVEASIVQPFPGASDYADVHNRIFNLAKKFPGKIYGVASVNPHMAKNDYEREVRRCVEDLHFVGVKLHTIGHAVSPLSRDARTVYELAIKLNVPVIVHTGAGIPFSLPSLCIPVANEYKNLNFILAHSGASILSGEAIITAKECKNVYLELTWCGIEDAIAITKNVSSKKIMFASDSINNVSLEIEKFRNLKLGTNFEIDVFNKTAKKVFNLK